MATARHHGIWRGVAGLILCLLAPSWSHAAELRLIGRDGGERLVTSAEIAAMAMVEARATLKGVTGEETATYRGPLLWSVASAGGLFGDADMRTRLRLGLIVEGKDGYGVLVATGEIDPDFEGKPVLLAIERDGKPIPEGQVRLIVPGDKKGGRAVRDVVAVRVAKPG